MADELLIDAHLHLYETKAMGQRDKDAYEIWEYGAKDDVVLTPFGGDIEDAEAALAGAGYAHAVIANLFAVELLDDGLRAADRQVQADHLQAFNRWACDVAAGHPRFTVFAAVDPIVLGGEPGAAHLRDMVERHGAGGVKIHPVVQGFMPEDPRMHPIYEACVELGIPVLSHSGSARGGATYGEPSAFAAVLRRFPDLTLVLAHLGGGAWRQTAALAEAFPQVAFDLCEIIAWTGAPNAPTSRELAKLILDIGPERVMLGTDFPWYDLADTASRVMDLPLLSREQKTAILGANAARILRLKVRTARS
jgi:uncharacterized protein